MYVSGEGKPQDIQKAAEHYRLAAELGFSKAQYNLALLIASGKLPDSPLSEAYLWLSLAQKSKTAEDIVKVSAQSSLEKLQAHMSAEEIAQGKRLTQDWNSRLEN